MPCRWRSGRQSTQIHDIHQAFGLESVDEPSDTTYYTHALDTRHALVEVDGLGGRPEAQHGERGRERLLLRLGVRDDHGYGCGCVGCVVGMGWDGMGLVSITEKKTS